MATYTPFMEREEFLKKLAYMSAKERKEVAYMSAMEREEFLKKFL